MLLSFHTEDFASGKQATYSEGLGGQTFFVERVAVRTEVLFMIPGHVPRLARCHSTTFTPNACHAHLNNHTDLIKQSYELTEDLLAMLNIVPNISC